MLAEALDAPSAAARQRALQRLGDVSLFIAGFFARSFARKLIDIDYHIAMGGNAYGTLADSMQRSASGRAIGAIYAELAQKFQRLVDALNEVSEMSYVHSDADILRLYEIWMKTGSRRAHGLLNRLGVRPVRQGGLGVRHSRGSARPTIAARPALRLHVDHDVYDFLVTDRRALAGVGAGERSARARRGAAARRDGGRRRRRSVHRSRPSWVGSRPPIRWAR